MYTHSRAGAHSIDKLLAPAHARALYPPAQPLSFAPTHPLSLRPAHPCSHSVPSPTPCAILSTLSASRYPFIRSIYHLHLHARAILTHSTTQSRAYPHSASGLHTHAATRPQSYSPVPSQSPSQHHATHSSTSFALGGEEAPDLSALFIRQLKLNYIHGIILGQDMWSTEVPRCTMQTALERCGVCFAFLGASALCCIDALAATPGMIRDVYASLYSAPQPRPTADGCAPPCPAVHAALGVTHMAQREIAAAKHGTQSTWTFVTVYGCLGGDVRLSDFMPVVAKNKWVPDEEAPHCRSCGKEFTMIKRRHHCRFCGEVICGGCSKNRRPNTTKMKMVRVCDLCFYEKAADTTDPNAFLKRMTYTVPPPE